MSTTLGTEQAPQDSRSVTESVLHAIADELDADLLDLEPLHDAVDPDALETIFDDTSSTSRNTGSVTFESNGCAVTVAANGSVTVQAMTTSNE
ncbi:HalOD1 output domain-containing protein [Halostella pelagica]|uniref:HalOD1 output domain-containing protein n=1 Tax=Halostella pelagica TaxID=2583824 RepID=UPI0010821F4E|nr:HalOD1 output domain-containing protein [Halostella pelagica]